MLDRILLSTIAAAALLTAAPALAGESSSTGDACTCCSDGSFHSDHHLREANRNAPAGGATQGAADEDPYVRNQSWGG